MTQIQCHRSMHHGLRISHLACCLAIFILPVVAGAADWVQFRGVRGGQAESAVPLPLEIGPERHVLWKAELPPGHSSPIVVGDRIFLTAVRDKKQLLTMAVERSTGKVLWEREAKYERLEPIHNIGSHAQCSPASDGERVVSFFGSSGMYCYSLDGKLQWQIAMGPFNDEFGASSSPLVADDRVILGQDHDTGSFLAAFDKKTGKELWRTDRSEYSRNASSPVIWTVNGKKQIVVAGTLRVCGYDWDSGRQLWTVRGLSRVVCMTPVVGPDNMLIVAGWSAGGDPGERLALVPFEQVVGQLDANQNGTFEKDEIKDGPVQSRFTQCDRDKDGHITRAEYEEFQTLFDKSQNVVMAIKPGVSGDATETHVAWKFSRFVPFCASPLYHDGFVYLIKDGGILTCLDAKTGEAKKTGRVAGTGNYYASPAVGDGKVYLLSEKGQLSVVSADASWQVLHTVDFGQAGYASPAILDGRIYLRVGGELYCFGLSEKN